MRIQTVADTQRYVQVGESQDAAQGVRLKFYLSRPFFCAVFQIAQTVMCGTPHVLTLPVSQVSQLQLLQELRNIPGLEGIQVQLPATQLQSTQQLQSPAVDLSGLATVASQLRQQLATGQEEVQHHATPPPQQQQHLVDTHLLQQAVPSTVHHCSH